ncbi:hypothetical protein [Methylobacter tundripaludum]|uniref:Uncharacterized protein n=1 Tax=Methylobacter tundripaludum (strain ATCC BAA-1195 / DSM 17260 / SV96) TaxID=697282 RepID=G3IYT8_METTV|nr:hypothetical protein [Methylobacter tundripaludum]EGW21239.1 hypothetical protein Mettu_4404 [Methylobacter tundripaludum SV96]
MARGGKRENSGRPKSEPTKTIRVPDGALDAVEAFIRLYKGDEAETDYVILNIAIAKTKWCAMRGDFTDSREIKNAVKILEKRADELERTDPNDINALQNWDEAIKLEALAEEWSKIGIKGLDI